MFTSILHAVAHLPLLAPELLFHDDHHLGTYSVTILVDTLVLATGAAALHFDVISVSYARYFDRLFHLI